MGGSVFVRLSLPRNRAAAPLSGLEAKTLKEPMRGSRFFAALSMANREGRAAE